MKSAELLRKSSYELLIPEEVPKMMKEKQKMPMLLLS